MGPEDPQGILAQQLMPKPMGKPSIIGIILDAIAGAGGQRGGYGAVREEQRQQHDLLERSMLAQQIEQQQWQQREAYKRANPEPRAPHYWEMNDGSLGVVDGSGPRVLYKDPTPKPDIMWVRNYDGTMTPYPRNGVTPPVDKPVGKLTPITPGGAGSGPRTFP